MKLADRTKAFGETLAFSLGVSAVVLSLASPAQAIQPLSAFIEASNDANTDLQISRSTNEQRDAEADRSTSALLPSFSAQGTYTRNQFEVAFPGQRARRNGHGRDLAAKSVGWEPHFERANHRHRRLGTPQGRARSK